MRKERAVLSLDAVYRTLPSSSLDSGVSVAVAGKTGVWGVKKRALTLVWCSSVFGASSSSREMDGSVVNCQRRMMGSEEAV